MKHIEKNGGGQTTIPTFLFWQLTFFVSQNLQTFRKLGKHRKTNSEQLGPKYETPIGKQIGKK